MRYSKIMTGVALACLAFPLGCQQPPKKQPAAHAPIVRKSAPTLEEIARKANRGDKQSQEQLAARYASGNEVVKDEILSEQWLLRANPKMSPTSGGNANASIQKKKEEKAAAEKQRAQKTAVAAQAQKPAAAPTPAAASSKAATPAAEKPAGDSAEANAPATPAAQPKRDDFHLILRKASQGDRAALNKIRSDAALRRRFDAYAKTPEGKRNPFVREVQNRLKQ